MGIVVVVVDQLLKINNYSTVSSPWKPAYISACSFVGHFLSTSACDYQCWHFALTHKSTRLLTTAELLCLHQLSISAAWM